MTAEEVVDFIGARLRQRPPAGVSVAYLDGFMRRHRAALVQLFREQLGERLAGRALPAINAEGSTLPKENVSAPPAPQTKSAPKRNDALTLLAALQREARLIDLVQEPLGDYSA